MRLTKSFIGLGLFALSLGGCGGEDNAPTESQQARLARYRAALPSAATLQAAVPEASASNVLGDPAEAPLAIVPIIHDVNGAVVDLLTVIETVTSQPPTVYSELSSEFFWGLFPNDDGVGHIGIYVRENPPGSDFQYSYAIGRAPENAIAGFEPIVWGGSNPDADNPDFGSGAILWDFEANHFFEVAHNDNYDEQAGTRGRFVSVFGRGPDEADASKTVTLVYAAFANFQDHGEPPVDAEYLYGQVDDGTNDLRFVDIIGEQDFADGETEAPETMSLHAAFLNSGVGRAENTYSGEAIADDETAASTECWDAALDRTYYSWTLGEQTGGEGEESACGAIFSQSLTALGVPSLANVPDYQRALLTELAETGIPTN
ncbi:MAG: hypothetical protein IPL79_16485 [Myxococcales bacterium]|nr:hypothetical protein [Myxococcales bacterium]